MSKKTKKDKQIKSIKTKDKVESSPKILACSFNKFFVTTVENINKKIIHTNVKDYLENSAINPFFL